VRALQRQAKAATHALTEREARITTAPDLTILLPLEKRETSAVRRSLQDLLSRHAVPRAIADDVVLSAQEACNNVIVHSHDGGGGIQISAWCRDHRVCVEVRDHGQGFDAARIDHVRTPAPYRTHGRGLFLIYNLMDDVEVRSGSGGTVVRMWKRTRTA
jgi:anti-sigma regulatory factor (Ser/Thr protein kinase)